MLESAYQPLIRLRGGEGVASLILTTHRSTEKAMAGAVADLKDEPSVLENPVLLRIFESLDCNPLFYSSISLF